MTRFMRLIVMLVATACVGKPAEWTGTVEIRMSSLHDETLYVRIHIPKAEASHIAVGDTMPFRLDAFPDETFIGKVEHVTTAADSPFTVDIAIVSNKDELRAGMAAIVLGPS